MLRNSNTTFTQDKFIGALDLVPKTIMLSKQELQQNFVGTAIKHFTRAHVRIPFGTYKLFSIYRV